MIERCSPSNRGKWKLLLLQMEGREESESEEEEAGDDEGAAEEAALQAALGDGAQVVSQADTTTRGGDEDGDLSTPFFLA